MRQAAACIVVRGARDGADNRQRLDAISSACGAIWRPVVWALHLRLSGSANPDLAVQGPAFLVVSARSHSGHDVYACLCVVALGRKVGIAAEAVSTCCATFRRLRPGASCRRIERFRLAIVLGLHVELNDEQYGIAEKIRRAGDDGYIRLAE